MIVDFLMILLYVILGIIGTLLLCVVFLIISSLFADRNKFYEKERKWQKKNNSPRNWGNPFRKFLKTLENRLIKEGIQIINLGEETTIDWKSGRYQAIDRSHPNGLLWEEAAKILQRKLNL